VHIGLHTCIDISILTCASFHANSTKSISIFMKFGTNMGPTETFSHKNLAHFIGIALHYDINILNLLTHSFNKIIIIDGI